MKKKIIVPVDFSINSQNAYLYAREMAKILNCSLEVVHVFAGNLNADENVVLAQGKTKEEALNKKLEEFVGIYPSEDKGEVLTKVKVDTYAVQGMVIPTLLTYTKDPSVEMVIMGARGESDLFDKIFGTVSSALAQKADCPVLVIPKGAKFKAFDHILYASNFESAKEEMIDKIRDFGNIFRSALHFIHVDNKEPEEDVEALEDRIFNTLFKRGYPAFSFNLATIKDTHVTEGLRKYADENEIDLVVLVNRQYQVFDRVFEESTTRKMARFTNTPLLVYHDRVN